jgi:hypothetical protein
MAPDVTLNPADCSLDCQLQGHLASTLSDEGFGYLWSGGCTTQRSACAAAAVGNQCQHKACTIAEFKLTNSVAAHTPVASCILNCTSTVVVASRLSAAFQITGVRATHGITSGRFWFAVRLLEPLETTAANIGDSADAYNDDETTANTIHCCRCG